MSVIKQEDIAHKSDEEETNLGAKPIIHEGLKNLYPTKTKPDMNSDNISKPTKTCVTDIIATQTNENILDNTDAKSSMEDFTKLKSENEILEEIDALFDISSSAARGDRPLNKTGSGDVEMNANPDDSFDNTITNCDKPTESKKQTPKCHADSNTDNKCDKIINSDTEKVDEDKVLNIKKPDDEKDVSEDTLDNKKEDIEITKNDEDKGTSNDGTYITNDTEIADATEQNSDSNEDMILRWDDMKPNEEKDFSEDTIDSEKENIENPINNSVLMDKTNTEMLDSDEVITKNYEDKGTSNDSLDSIDRIGDTEIADATEQNSDSNEDMILRWDDMKPNEEKDFSEDTIDIKKENIENPIDNSVPVDKTDIETLISGEVITKNDEDKCISNYSIDSIDRIGDTEIADAKERNVIGSTIDISAVEQTIDKKDENLSNDVTETIREEIANTAQNDDVNSINKEPMLKQSDATSAMEVDIVNSDTNNDNNDLNEEIQESSSIHSPLKTTEDTETKMDLDLSLAQDETITTTAVEDAQKCPVEKKVDVHNPDTSVKEYNIDLSIVTGEVNGPERNVDCYDLLQIKDENKDSSLDDSIVINTEHGLNKPDVMLEIPTQELIDFDDSNDDDEIPTLDETVDGNANEIEQQISSAKTQGTSEEKEESKEDPKMLKGNQEKDNVVEPKIIDNQTKKLVEKDKNKEIDSQTKGQVTQEKDKEIDSQTKSLDKLTVKDSLGTIQGVNIPESSKEGIKDIPLDSEKKKETKVAKALEDIEESIESIAKEIEDPQKIIDAQPSTSTEMTPDTADEVPDVSDSLGLLAESSRVVEDDDDDDGFDDEDFDQDDESSNQISAEHSEDSNAPPSESDAPQSESDAPKGQDGKEIETPALEKDGDFDFQTKVASKTEDGGKDGAMECEEIISPERTTGDESHPTDEETKLAVENIMEEKTMDQSVEIETVKLSDTSDNEADSEMKVEKRKKSVLRQLLLNSKEGFNSLISVVQIEETNLDEPNESSKLSPSKTKKLEIATQKNFVNIVDLEESSSEEDIDQKQEQHTPSSLTMDKDSVTSVNIPDGVEVMSLSGAGGMSEMRHKGDEMIISGVPKPPPHKPARLNTSEVTIKTAITASTLVIPEIPKIGLEIFNIDSDEDSCSAIKEGSTASPKSEISEEIKETTKEKCINLACKSDGTVPFVPANASTVAYFNFKKKRRPRVCQNCADMVATRAQELVKGIKQFTPILDLDAGKEPQELVEISDSESEDEIEVVDEVKMMIEEKEAEFLQENLGDIINETWMKFKMDERLENTKELLFMELQELEKQSKEIDDIFNECQISTDKLRNELYATFDGEKQEMPALVIFDTPYSEFVLPEEEVTMFNSMEPRQSKRRLSSASDVAAPAKRPAIPLGYTPLDSDASAQNLLDKTPVPVDNSMKIDDDRDISVVQLSAEAAPADLPAPGELLRAPIKAGMPVFAMRNAFGSWLKGKVLECQAKGTSNNQPFTMCRVKFEHKVKNPCKVLSARCLAYAEPADVRMTIGTRVIALCRDSTNTGKRDSFYAGVVAEIPNPVNNYRYLVFFDDGYAQYVVHSDTRLVCECSHLVWEEVHPFSREFVKDYLLAYPERPMVRLHAGQSLKTEWNGKWWVSRVVVVDASLAQVQFDEDNRVEWIYRGSTRLAPLYLELQAAERTRTRARPLPRSKNQARSNMPYVEYTRTDEQGGNKTDEMQVQEQQQNEEMRRQRAVAKKSTATPAVAAPPNVAGNLDTVTSRVVYYTPKNAVKPLKMSAHTCGPKCKRTDVLALKELRTYNPLAKPLLSGWERQIVRFKGQKEVMYRAPCGRRVRDLSELHRYLRTTRSDMPVDLFDFHPSTHCLAEFVLNKCNVGKKDLSHGKENVPVPCVNYYDDSLPEFCSYNTERTPTAGVPLNLDPDFLCGCDCTDDCADKSKCACWKLTLEGARTIGLEGFNVGYSYRRLPEPLPSGIYECNSRCKCRHTCLNRVAQHPLQLKLQVFKTLNRGWGIRALNDVPKGSFLCVYAGNLLTDATANLDGLNEGDEYLAELDYIEVVEQMKEGFEADIPEADKNLAKKEGNTDDKQTSSEETSSEDEEDTPDKNDVMDDDFSPGYIGPGLTEFSKRLRRRGKGKKGEKVEENDNKEKEAKKDGNGDEECITISDDEEVRQPSRFTAQAGMGANEFVPKYKSVRAHFGKDEACYIMDAKVQGNIGRYLNHSCSPNVFVQNVFVDTHDPRFPWVAFFALSHIRAGTELTWNYNYDIGSVPEKVLYCFCGAPNCRRRLL